MTDDILLTPEAYRMKGLGYEWLFAQVDDLKAHDGLRRQKSELARILREALMTLVFCTGADGDDPEECQGIAHQFLRELARCEWNDEADLISFNEMKAAVDGARMQS